MGLHGEDEQSSPRRRAEGAGLGSPRAGFPFLSELWVTGLLLFTWDLQKEATPHLRALDALMLLGGCNY